MNFGEPGLLVGGIYPKYSSGDLGTNTCSGELEAWMCCVSSTFPLPLKPRFGGMDVPIVSVGKIAAHLRDDPTIYPGLIRLW